MLLKENQKLICAGHMPLRAPDGKQLAAVPVYKIVSADEAGEAPTAALAPNERLVLVGTTERRETAEERYNAILAGDIPPKKCAEPLYIKDFNSANDESEITESEKRILRPFINDLINEFSAFNKEKR